LRRRIGRPCCPTDIECTDTDTDTDTDPYTGPHAVAELRTYLRFHA
jgi:hypothetical protein